MIVSPNSTMALVCTKLDRWNANFPNKYTRKYLNCLQKDSKHWKVRFGRDINNTSVQSISQSAFKEKQRGTYLHILLNERVLCVCYSMKESCAQGKTQRTTALSQGLKIYGSKLKTWKVLRQWTLLNSKSVFPMLNWIQNRLFFHSS